MESLRQTDASGTDAAAARGRILDAAQAVFAARGYAAATTREIAERAGIAKRMLFYYFPNKDAVYHAVLERVIAGFAGIHDRFQGDPGPVGLGEVIEGMTHYVAANLDAFRVYLREIIDDGPHLESLARQYIKPMFDRGAEEVRRNMQEGVFRPGDPMHVLFNVGGLTLFYFLTLPMTRHVWDRDPLAPDTLAERAAAVRDALLFGLVGKGPSTGGSATGGSGS